MYVGSNHDIGSHTTLEGAKAALDRKMKDGSIKPKGKVLKSGLRLGRISKLGSEVRAFKRKMYRSVEAVAFFGGIRRTTCTETPS